MATNQALRIAKALIDLDKEYAEYGPVIARIRLVKDNREKTTMWVNPHCEMGYSEKCLSKLDAKQLKALVHHELLHVINGHFTRHDILRRIFGPYNFDAHNISMDLEINSVVENLPTWMCFPKNYKMPDNLTYEEYFQKLIKDAVTVTMSGGSGNGKEPGLSQPNDTDLNWINECEDVQNKTSSNENLSSEDELFLDNLLEEVKEAAQTRGTESSKGKTKIKLTVKKPLNILQYIRTQCSKIRNNRTFGFDNVNYNQIRSSTLPKVVNFGTYSELIKVSIAFIIDVSGSRTDRQINDSISKILATLKTVDDMEFVMDLYFTDANVTQINRIQNPSDIPKTYKGRGGTVLSTAFKHFKCNYDLIVIMTDGFIDWHEVNTLDVKYKYKTVIGIDKESYLSTCNHSKLPTFVL